MRLIRGAEIPFEPASHENPLSPGVWKRVLARKGDLFHGQVQMINWSKFPKGSSFARHYHEDLEEIFIILDGRVRAVVENESGKETVELIAGDCLIVSPGERHAMTNLADHDVNYLVVGIAGDKNGKTIVETSDPH